MKLFWGFFGGLYVKRSLPVSMPVSVAISILLVVLMSAMGLATMFSSRSASASSLLAGGGSDVPFPLNYPLPFPWSTIEGVWNVDSHQYSAMYTFAVENDCNGRQILKVIQIDPTSHVVLAAGIGYQVDGSDQVTAAMNGPNGSYMLYVGAYEDSLVAPVKKAYVLRLVAFSGAAEELRVRIQKVADQVVGHGNEGAGQGSCQ